MSNLPSGQLMRDALTKVKEMLPIGWGATLLVYPFNKKGIANYISDAERADMIKYLRETADRIEKNQRFDTPESN